MALISLFKDIYDRGVVEDMLESNDLDFFEKFKDDKADGFEIQKEGKLPLDDTEYTISLTDTNLGYQHVIRPVSMNGVDGEISVLSKAGKTIKAKFLHFNKDLSFKVKYNNGRTSDLNFNRFVALN